MALTSDPVTPSSLVASHATNNRHSNQYSRAVTLFERINHQIVARTSVAMATVTTGDTSPWAASTQWRQSRYIPNFCVPPCERIALFVGLSPQHLITSPILAPSTNPSRPSQKSNRSNTSLTSATTKWRLKGQLSGNSPFCRPSSPAHWGLVCLYPLG